MLVRGCLLRSFAPAVVDFAQVALLGLVITLRQRGCAAVRVQTLLHGDFALGVVPLVVARRFLMCLFAPCWGHVCRCVSFWT